METPILTMLRRYSQGDPARFHMPGHKGRAEPLPMTLDVTELHDTDSLYEGGPAVQRARALAAAACGANETWLLVGGATAGIHAMIAYAQGPVAVSRCAHRSVYAAGWLMGREQLLASPVWDARENMVRCETPALTALAEPGQWTLVTSPNYYGCVCALEPLSVGPLLVDAAHGAHFAFSGKLPSSPARWASLWVESAHKTLSAPTQTAWLHRSASADGRRVDRILAAIGSSSPSWLLLAGLDRARAEAEEARPAWDALVSQCLELERAVSALPGLLACGADWARSLGYTDKDPTRLVIDVRGTGRSGFEAAGILRERGVQVEMADFYRLVFIMTPADTQRDRDRLWDALTRLSRMRTGAEYAADISPPAFPEAVCSAYEAFGRPSRRLSLPGAIGRVAAASAGAYPPGIPCWLPGERITRDAADWITRIRELGGQLFGVDNDTVEVLQ
ncbi:MAG: hypothetical protein GX549_04890 [Clostridiales bacterium]|nr:hypothetical protein [Clostridiales bacterium]